MILHVYDLAIRSSIGEVLVVTPDKAIFELVENYGGKSFLSKDFHETGTDCVFEGCNKFFSNNP